MIDTRAILEHAEDCPKHRYTLLKEVCDAYGAALALLREARVWLTHTETGCCDPATPELRERIDDLLSKVSEP